MLKTKAELLAMNSKDIVAYAAEEFGLSLDARKKPENLLADFEQQGGEYGDGSDNQDPPNDPPPNDPPADEPPADDPPVDDPPAKAAGNKKLTPNHDLIEEAKKAKRRIRITIHGGSGEDGGSDVPIGVNGTVILVKREEMVAIKPEYLHVLDLAVQTEFYKDPKTGAVKERDVKRFNVTVHGLA